MGNEKEGMLRKLEKKSKKSNKNAATSGLGVTANDVKAEEGDFSIDEEKLAVLETRKERDKKVMETKAAGESDVKREKRRGGKHPGKSNKDCDEDAVKCVEKKKKNKLKKSNKNAATSGLGVTANDVKAKEGDFSIDEEKLAVLETRKERDKKVMETKAAGESDVKREKKRGGKHPGKSNKDCDEDAVKCVEKKKKNKLKKNNTNAATSGLGVTANDVKAEEGDFSFDEEKLAVLENRKERDKEVMETKAPGESDVKRKKKREGGKHPGKSNKDCDEDAVICVEKKKKNKLKKSCLDEPLETKTSARASASETQDSDKVVETLGEVSGGNAVDEIRRKKKSMKNIKTTATNDVGVTNTKAKSEDCNIKRKKKREGRKHPGKSTKESDEDVSKSIEEKKSNKLKKSCQDERETNIEDGQEDTVAEVNQGDISSTVGEIEEESRTDNCNIRKRKKATLGHSSEDHTHERSEKRVKFSGHVQIFPLSSDANDENGEIEEENLLRGRRFSKLEDEIVKEAVHKYIGIHNLGEEGLKKILNSRSYPELKGCWKEIGSAIPYRPYTAVYYRAQILFRRSETRKWTEEEYEMVREYQKEHGNNWKVLADELGKHRFHVKDTWRRLKVANQKKGQWTQEEYQTLFDLVNTDLRLKLFEEKKSKYGMLRDNIAWGAISDRLSTRTDANCCLKWYDQLTSPMVAKGEWADADDYRLVDALFELDASCIEDVDWDNLFDHRPGEICRKRWNQMVLHIGQHGNRSFPEQVEVLAKRYRPDLAEVREAWDNKPVVPP